MLLLTITKNKPKKMNHNAKVYRLFPPPLEYSSVWTTPSAGLRANVGFKKIRKTLNYALCMH